MEKNIDSIKRDVLAITVHFDKDIESSKEFNINGENVKIGLKQLR